MNEDELANIGPSLEAWLERFRDCFASNKSFAHWRTYVIGLLSNIQHKTVESIALSADMAVRTLQFFLGFGVWDHEKITRICQRATEDEYGSDEAIGILDETSFPKKGDKTPGVSRQYCGESGKVDNCVVSVNLLFDNNDERNPYTSMLDGELFLPESWDQDQARRREAHIPPEMFYRPKWLIGAELFKSAIGNGVRLDWATFDEAYGKVPRFWFALDGMGIRGVGEVPKNFLCWTSIPKYQSLQGPFAAKRVDNVCKHSPVFREQAWRPIHVKDATRGPMIWEAKAARVHIVNKEGQSPGIPSERAYWLIVARCVNSGVIKYFLSNAAENVTIEQMMRVAFHRWQIEKWFERAKQRCGFGDFELRNYPGLMRHWISCMVAMAFVGAYTHSIRQRQIQEAESDRGDGQDEGTDPGQPTAKGVSDDSQTLNEELDAPARRLDIDGNDANGSDSKSGQAEPNKPVQQNDQEAPFWVKFPWVTFEQVVTIAAGLFRDLVNYGFGATRSLLRIAKYYQNRNRSSYRSRWRTQKLRLT